jgi:hypothetical protein
VKTFGVVFIAFSLMFARPVYSAVWVITYPQEALEDDIRYDYPLALLALALDKTSVRYELKASTKPMRQARALKRLEENLEINVVWAMTDTTREEHLLPVRIPIAKGLIGWRMFVAPKNSRFVNADINSLSDLLEYEPVQGIAWPDTKILQANGFNVVTSRDYAEALNMIKTRQADFFPRSVIEVERETESQASTTLTFRPGIAVRYPSAMYFFFNKRNITLAKLVETGLHRAIEDGSFDALFMEHFGGTIERLDLNGLSYFQLANPLLPPLTPTADERLWYYPVGARNPQ